MLSALVFLVLLVLLMFLPLPVIANKSIHFKIYNLNKFLSNLDIDRFIKDKTILLFNCKGSKFIDQLHKHLTILTYNRLKNVFTRDPKCREKKTISFMIRILSGTLMNANFVHSRLIYVALINIAFKIP